MLCYIAEIRSLNGQPGSNYAPYVPKIITRFIWVKWLWGMTVELIRSRFLDKTLSLVVFELNLTKIKATDRQISTACFKFMRV